jgi:hypothetical protein
LLKGSGGGGSVPRKVLGVRIYTPLGEITIGGVEAGGMCADDGLVTGIGGWMLTGGVELGWGNAFTGENVAVESNALLSSASIPISGLALPKGHLLENGMLIFDYLLLHSSHSGDYPLEPNTLTTVTC